MNPESCCRYPGEAEYLPAEELFLRKEALCGTER